MTKIETADLSTSLGPRARRRESSALAPHAKLIDALGQPLRGCANPRSGLLQSPPTGPQRCDRPLDRPLVSTKSLKPAPCALSGGGFVQRDSLPTQPALARRGLANPAALVYGRAIMAGVGEKPYVGPTLRTALMRTA
jgi:hypothetical protein